MTKMKILNLYAGIGGNRKLWGNNYKITAVEIDPEIASVYQDSFPKDRVIVGDAHKYLLEHYKEFDFIWCSPPCPTHSRARHMHKKKIYPDMKLWQEIIFLQENFKGKWVVENVIPYYKELIPFQTIGRHAIWSNVKFKDTNLPKGKIKMLTKEQLSEYHKMPIPNARHQRLLLRNCVNPKIAKHIFKQVVA